MEEPVHRKPSHRNAVHPDGIYHGGRGEPQRRTQFYPLCCSVLSVVTRFTALLAYRHSAGQ